MENFTVYMHVSPNGKKYIGITSRKPEHRWNDGKGYVKNKYFYNASLKYGWDNFEHIIVADGLSKYDACRLEQALISGCKSTDPQYGYNMSLGGESGTYGVKYGPEFCQKVRERMSGPNNFNYGKKLSEETRKKLSDTRKGKWSPRQQEALKRRWKQNGVPVICLETGEVFDSLAAAGNKIGCCPSGIKAACKGVQISSHGLHWAYFDNQTDDEISELLLELHHKKEMVYKIRSVPNRGKHKNGESVALRNESKPKPVVKPIGPKYLVPVYCIETKVAYATSVEAARRFSVDVHDFFNHVGRKKTITPGRHWKFFSEEKDDYVMFVR